MHGACVRPVATSLILITAAEWCEKAAGTWQCMQTCTKHIHTNSRAKCGFPEAYSESFADIHGLKKVLEIMWKR